MIVRVRSKGKSVETHFRSRKRHGERHNATCRVAAVREPPDQHTTQTTEAKKNERKKRLTQGLATEECRDVLELGVLCSQCIYQIKGVRR